MLEKLRSNLVAGAADLDKHSYSDHIHNGDDDSSNASVTKEDMRL
jgi:hypothetical protein